MLKVLNRMNIKQFMFPWQTCSCCWLALIMLIAMLQRTANITFNMKTKTQLKNFMDSLSVKQKTIYENIIQERKSIYYKGFLLGFSITLLYLLFYSSYNKNNIIWKNACISVVITGIVTYLYYILSPKSNYIILSLTNEKQRELWLDIYKTMQYNYHVSFIYGLAGVMFLSFLY